MTKAEFEQGVRRNQDKLFRMAYLSLRSYADCQDAVQEALLKGWAARRLTSELTNEIPADFAPPDPDLRDAIRALDGKLRAPLLLRYIAGYSIGETARLLRITPAQVRWRLERAKKQLRAQLGDKEEII